MPRPVEQLYVEFTAQTREFRAAVRQINQQTSRLARQQTRATARISRQWASVGRSVGNAAGGFAAAFISLRGINNFISRVLSATQAQQRAIILLDNAIQSTGRSTEGLSDALQEFAAFRQTITSFGDEATLEAAQVALRFEGLQTAQLPRLLTLAQDISTVFGIDLVRATRLLGQAFSDPAAASERLLRLGVRITDEQQEQIKVLEEQGRLIEAATILFDSLQAVQGASVAEADTLAGVIQQVQNAYDDAFEVGGEGSENLQESLRELTNTLSGDEFQSAVQTFANNALDGLDAVARGFIFINEEAEEFIASLQLIGGLLLLLVANNPFLRAVGLGLSVGSLGGSSATQTPAEQGEEIVSVARRTARDIEQIQREYNERFLNFPPSEVLPPINPVDIQPETEDAAEAAEEYNRLLAEATQELARQEESWAQIGTNIDNALFNLISGTGDFRQLLGGILRDLSRFIFEQATGGQGFFEQIFRSVGSGFIGDLFGGGGFGTATDVGGGASGGGFANPDDFLPNIFGSAPTQYTAPTGQALTFNIASGVSEEVLYRAVNDGLERAPGLVADRVQQGGAYAELFK